MELAVTPFRALTHEVQQSTVGQYGRLLLPAVPPAPTPEATTLGAGQWDQQHPPSSCQACTQQNLKPPLISTHVNTPVRGLGAQLSSQSPPLSCSS